MKRAHTLVVNLFGELAVFHDDTPLPSFPTRNSALLFSRLILNAGHYLSREALAEDMWNDCSPEIGKKRLRTELWRIRRIIESATLEAGRYLQMINGSVRFNSNSSYRLDVADFEISTERLLQCSPQDLNDTDYRLILHCIDQYRGDFLESINDEWCRLRRESLRTKYLLALEMRMLYHKFHQQWDQAIFCAGKLLDQDPLLEHIHVELMSFYHAKGNRPLAIRQFDICRRKLCEDLGVSPMEKTIAAYRKIIARSDNPISGRLVPAGTQGQTYEYTLKGRLDQARSHIEQADALLNEASRQIE